MIEPPPPMVDMVVAAHSALPVTATEPLGAHRRRVRVERAHLLSIHVVAHAAEVPREQAALVPDLEFDDLRWLCVFGHNQSMMEVFIQP